ncbi:MAG: cobalamin-binding protein [Chloroflexi bacterium]|nr:cobalamin-binding protein [Chloroflexota bacterium]
MSEIDDSVSRAIVGQQEVLAQIITETLYRQEPELLERHGQRGRAACLRDVNYHLSYLAEAIASDTPQLFVDYIAWVRSILSGIGSLDDDFPRHLGVIRDVLLDSLPTEMHAPVLTYLEASLKEDQQPLCAQVQFAAQGTPYADLAQQYLAALLRTDRQAASILILNAVRDGVSVKDIYTHVFQPTQHEVGRLWQANQLSVAQEHYCTAATQLIMSQLYPYIFNSERVGRRLVATCVGGELHEIGIRMVADFFEMAGWDTYYLGANTPSSSILQVLTTQKANVLGISATMQTHIGTMRDLIQRVRAAEEGRNVAILVGGYPFRVAPGLWLRVGADGYGVDAEDAIAVAETLTAGTH